MEKSHLNGESNTTHEPTTSVWRDIADHIEILDSNKYNVGQAANEFRDELLDNLVLLSRTEGDEAKKERDAILDELNNLKAIIDKWKLR